MKEMEREEKLKVEVTFISNSEKERTSAKNK